MSTLIKPMWNGEVCKVKGVIVEVKAGEGFFMWWQLYVGKFMKGLEVTYGGSTFVLYDGDGEATRKVLAGGGPNMPHAEFSNFEIWDARTNVQFTKRIECNDHKWSDDEIPIFQTVTKYCTKCRTAKLAEEMLANMKKNPLFL